MELQQRTELVVADYPAESAVSIGISMKMSWMGLQEMKMESTQEASGNIDVSITTMNTRKLNCWPRSLRIRSKVARVLNTQVRPSYT